mmetsp:Transcript_33619/g.51813  ORF Transcript_33619/g.51813 Transcript_33619/m.51813 type:complete len:794 (-) Transcript_33619:283-2664(-)
MLEVMETPLINLVVLVLREEELPHLVLGGGVGSLAILLGVLHPVGLVNLLELSQDGLLLGKGDILGAPDSLYESVLLLEHELEAFDLLALSGGHLALLEPVDQELVVILVTSAGEGAVEHEQLGGLGLDGPRGQDLVNEHFEDSVVALTVELKRNIRLDNGGDGEPEHILDDVLGSLSDHLALANVKELGAGDIVLLEHVVKDVIDLLARDAVLDLGELLLEGLQGLVVNLELGEAVVLVVNVVSERSSLSLELLNIEDLGIVLGGDVVNLGDLHVLIVESYLIFLNTEAVAVTLRVDLLVDSKLLDLATLLDDVVPDDVATGRLQPGVGPLRQVLLDAEALGGLAQVADEVLELGVLILELLEVRGKSNLEDLSAEVEEGLVQPGSALAVGNSVENVLGSLGVDHVQGDGVGGVLLVLTQAPEGLVEEDTPSGGIRLEALGFVKSQIADVISERLVKPEIIPPVHGDEVAEPHVRQLVEEGVHDMLPPDLIEFLVALHVVLAVDDAAYVLHGAKVIVGHEDLVDFLEGVGGGEGLLVVVDTALSDMEEAFLMLLNPLSDRLPGVQSHGVSVLEVLLVVGEDLLVRAGDQRIKIHADQGRLRELKRGHSFFSIETSKISLVHAELLELSREVFLANVDGRQLGSGRSHDPSLGDDSEQGVFGLEVRLVEAREGLVSVSSFVLREDVFFAIILVLEHVHTLAVANVLRLESDDDGVLALLQEVLLEVDSVVAEGLARSHFGSVNQKAVYLVSAVVGENVLRFRGLGSQGEGDLNLSMEVLTSLEEGKSQLVSDV